MDSTVSQTAEAEPLFKLVLNRLTPSQVPSLRRRKKQLHQLAAAQHAARQAAE